MNYNYLLGTLYILYGVIKIVVGLAVMLLPINIIENTQILKLFVKAAADKTFAGRMYEYVLLAFGVFSLFDGLALLELLTPSLAQYFESKHTEYTVFIILGLILTIFYSLVLYTNVPIQKDKEHYDHYKWLGLFGGISFLCMPIIWEFVGYILPKFRSLTYAQQSICMIGLAIVILIIIEQIYSNLKKKHITIVQALPPAYQESVNNTKEIGQTVANKIVL